jgi:hypothetical protein
MLGASAALARQSEVGMTRAKCSCVDPKAKRSGFGSLRVLPSGRHQARYTGPDGRQYKAPRTFDTHADAATWLTTVSADISRRLWEPPARPGQQLTLREYAEDWWTTRDL